MTHDSSADSSVLPSMWYLDDGYIIAKHYLPAARYRCLSAVQWGQSLWTAFKSLQMSGLVAPGTGRRWKGGISNSTFTKMYRGDINSQCSLGLKCVHGGEYFGEISIFATFVGCGCRFGKHECILHSSKVLSWNLQNELPASSNSSAMHKTRDTSVWKTAWEQPTYGLL